MHQIGEVKTAAIFGSDDQLQGANTQNEMFSEFSWPPYRFVSTYDQFDDDQRFAIKFIDFCPYTKKLCVGGAAGQVITFALNPMPADVMVEVSCCYHILNTSFTCSLSIKLVVILFYGGAIHTLNLLCVCCSILHLSVLEFLKILPAA